MASTSQRDAPLSPTLPLADRRLAWLALLVALYTLFAHLGGYPLFAPDEGRNAEVAREMMASGAWLVPTYNGATYLDKPAFFFRSVAVSLGAFGISEGAARLPSALSALALLALVYGFCRKVYDARTAAFAALVVATTPLFIGFSRIVIFDMMLGLFVSGAILAAYLAEDAEGPARSRWYLLAAASAGLATLVKGPVGFLIPLLVMAVFHASLGRREAIGRFFRPAHGLVFLGLVLPWFVGLSLACPDFPYYGIIKESLARFATSEFRRTQPVYFYALVIAAGLFPWSLALPGGLAAAWRERGRLSRPDRLFILWALVVVAFFSLSKSKLAGYILTAMVALAVLTGRLFAEALRRPEGGAARVVRKATVALLATTGLLALAAGAVALHPDLLGARLSPAGQVHWPVFQPRLPMLALSLGLMAALAAAALARRDLRLAFGAFLSVPVLLILLNFQLFATFAELRSGKSLAERIAARWPPATPLACLNCLPNGLPFYLGREITVVTDSGREFTSNYVLHTLASGQPRPRTLLPPAELDAWLQRQTRPLLLLARGAERQVLDAKARALGLASTELDRDFRAVLIPAPVPGGH
jgi:4-amino-4-deoxy-L-arabinose transferase-like glycosyltransferase